MTTVKASDRKKSVSATVTNVKMAAGAVGGDHDFSTDLLRQKFKEMCGESKQLSKKAFAELCASLNTGLEAFEINRVFENMAGTSEDISFEQFLSAVTRWRFLSCIVSAYGTAPFPIPQDYDYTKSTAENYLNPDQSEFAEEHRIFREQLDYSYHKNATIERQMWQDKVVSTVAKRTTRQTRPWLVYTSGPPGAGKSYALSWMSEHGFFPLENVVRIDPDFFKKIMPEWKGYVAADSDKAANLCHRESGFLAELALAVAMQNEQNVWVDTTLKDWQWFAKELERFNKYFPTYRKAIFYITAPEELIRERVKARGEATGRMVDSSIVDSAVVELPTSITKLTPFVDLVATISNERNGAAPVLKAVQVVDSKGSWNIIRNHFAHTDPAPQDFPNSLAPISLVRTQLQDKHFAGTIPLRPDRCMPLLPSSPVPSAQFAMVVRLAGLEELGKIDLLPSTAILHGMSYSKSSAVPGCVSVKVSPRFTVNLDNEGRKLALIPEDAHEFAWVYPTFSAHEVHLISSTKEQHEKDELLNPALQLLYYGGYVYYDVHHKVTAVNAVTAERTPHLLQFGPPDHLPDEAIGFLKRAQRWHPVSIDFLTEGGATHFAWVLPGERMPSQPISRYGAFAYLFTGRGSSKSLYFPITSAIWSE